MVCELKWINSVETFGTFRGQFFLGWYYAIPGVFYCLWMYLWAQSYCQVQLIVLIIMCYQCFYVTTFILMKYTVLSIKFLFLSYSFHMCISRFFAILMYFTNILIFCRINSKTRYMWHLFVGASTHLTSEVFRIVLLNSFF